MKKKTDASTETPETKDCTDQEESIFGIVPILIISLFIGLIAGAGIGISQILSVTRVVAVSMYLNRKIPPCFMRFLSGQTIQAGLVIK